MWCLRIFFYDTAFFILKMANLWRLLPTAMSITIGKSYFWKFCWRIAIWLSFIFLWWFNDFLKIVFLGSLIFCFWGRLFSWCIDIFINRGRFFVIFIFKIEFRFTHCLWNPSLRIHAELKYLTTLRVINLLQRIRELYFFWSTILLFAIFQVFLWIQLWLFVEIQKLSRLIFIFLYQVALVHINTLDISILFFLQVIFFLAELRRVDRDIIGFWWRFCALSSSTIIRCYFWNRRIAYDSLSLMLNLEVSIKFWLAVWGIQLLSG